MNWMRVVAVACSAPFLPVSFVTGDAHPFTERNA